MQNTLSKEQFELLIQKESLSEEETMLLEPYRAKRAIFIAAGFGSRLVPITINTPKPLVRVNGKRIMKPVQENGGQFFGPFILSGRRKKGLIDADLYAVIRFRGPFAGLQNAKRRRRTVGDHFRKFLLEFFNEMLRLIRVRKLVFRQKGDADGTVRKINVREFFLDRALDPDRNETRKHRRDEKPFSVPGIAESFDLYKREIRRISEIR